MPLLILKVFVNLSDFPMPSATQNCKFHIRILVFTILIKGLNF